MREIDPDILLEKEKQETRPVDLYDIYLGDQDNVDENTLFFAISPETIPFWDLEDSPQDYLPIGAQRSPVKHNMDLAIDYFNVTVDNVDKAFVALAAQFDLRDKRVALRTVFLDKIEGPEDAILLFDGVIDKPTLTESSINFQVVSRLDLKRKTGTLYQLMCRWNFGGTRCKFDRDSTKETGTADEGSSTSLIIDTARSEVTDYWKHGIIVFTSGDNLGQIRRVISSATSQLALDIVLPYSPIGNTYDIFQGCDKTLDWCHEHFDNRINFGGFHTLPIENEENL